jgi:hypothetical protein
MRGWTGPAAGLDGRRVGASRSGHLHRCGPHGVGALRRAIPRDEALPTAHKISAMRSGEDL